MNSKRLLAILLALCLVLGLCACGQTPAEEPEDTQTVAPAPEQTEAPAPEATEAPQVENTNPTYTVKIVDEGGNPIPGALIQMCQGETCMPGPLSGADGTVTFLVAEAEYKVSFLAGPPAGYDYSSQETEFYFEDGAYELTIVLKAVA